MSIQSLQGAIGESLGSSLTVRMSGAGGGWNSLSLKPVSPGWIASVFHTMVPTGYTKLQEERLAMVDLGAKSEASSLQNGYRQETSHIEGRRVLERASRASLTLADCGDGDCSETEPMLTERRLSGEEADGEEEEEEEGLGSNTQNMPKESVLAMAFQILVPFLLAGFGTVSAGMVLDVVQHWEAFQYITEIFILVPALLGLKGNLEMTLASRLSTAVNVGKMDSPIEKWNLIIGNLALKQVQATVVGFLAAVAAVVLGWIPEGKFQMSHAVLLCSSSVATAFIASLLQGIIMVGVIVGSKKTGINPDNVATPIAASFGDLITLAILAWISQGLYKCLDSYPYVSSLVWAFFMCLTPLWIVISSKHPASRTLLYSGWEPVITAMVISSIGGLILDKTVSDPNLAGIVVYTPVVNGIGGNLVAIQSSRISTHLHFHCAPGEVPDEAKGCYYPCRTFCGKGANHRSAQMLFLSAIPGHLIFLYAIHFMKSGHTTLTPIFMSVYLAAAMLQVLLLLCIADWMVHSIWRSGKDPDSFSIPYLTALGDLLGTALLALSFHFLWLIGDQDSDVGD
ncbi:solute carrier family 41 member 2 [Neolamprologus brichardi]|uniref:Solute carrier family 41 member n=1 Tax=Neolamprologus brichardi TaxID=32507 RepID=A0A3Q4N2H1_NEOBR|nr:solute carrier family 41 member 2 [Neolamprologus brichardi]XP_006806573.1 solute carrier family 41 member 2 [Neolamprologus brichardi]XP_006806574.1 solute carrier family 41 member 2 [Neolamprologus brichardi]XP_035770570.1 solute carrier family 41 member 2 [Neolamprologus brichardi]